MALGYPSPNEDLECRHCGSVHFGPGTAPGSLRCKECGKPLVDDPYA